MRGGWGRIVAMFEYLQPADKPVIDGLEAHEIVYAKDQAEYLPLRTLRSNYLECGVLSRWTLTPEQRKAVAEGADIFLELMTFGKPLQPILMAVSDNPNADFFRAKFNLFTPKPVVFENDGCKLSDKEIEALKAKNDASLPLPKSRA